jgi:hypothetical protein
LTDVGICANPNGHRGPPIATPTGASSIAIIRAGLACGRRQIFSAQSPLARRRHIFVSAWRAIWPLPACHASRRSQASSRF